MKNFTRTFTLTMVLILVLGGIVSASSDVTNGSIRVTEPFIEGIPAEDPVPHLDVGFIKLFTKRSDSPIVTDSDVGVYDNGPSDYYNRYYVKRYVTMKQGGLIFVIIQGRKMT